MSKKTDRRFLDYWYIAINVLSNDVSTEVSALDALKKAKDDRVSLKIFTMLGFSCIGLAVYDLFNGRQDNVAFSLILIAGSAMVVGSTLGLWHVSKYLKLLEPLALYPELCDELLQMSKDCSEVQKYVTSVVQKGRVLRLFDFVKASRLHADWRVLADLKAQANAGNEACRVLHEIQN